jgi:hypothetical protein
MTHVGYVAAGWIIPLTGFGLYAAWVLRRGRRLAERIPPEERRWSS